MAKRIELNYSRVVFNEAAHEYFLDGKQLSGITSVIQRQLFPEEYSSVPKKILDAAAEYGTSVHKSCELFDKEWTNDGTVEVQDYIDLCKEYSLTHEASEYLVSDEENYASLIDKLYRASENTFDIGDLKTYYGKLSGEKLEKCRWQLSIYAYLFEMQNPKAKVRNLFIMHIRNKQKKDGSWDHIKEMVFVDRIPSDICKELLDCDLRGEQFKNPFSIPKEICAQMGRIKELVDIKNKAEEELNAIKADILQSMVFLEVTNWATDEVRLTRTLPTTRQTFDLVKFKEAHPNITDYDDFYRISQVNGGLRIAV